jgi:23S rRNA pseudouridine1911/1915/1917 synthase
LPWLFAAFPDAKKKQVREWLKFGHVAVNGSVTTQFDRALGPGDEVMLHARGMAAPETKIAGGIRIRHEDADLVVIEKPAGLLSIASAAESERTAYALLTRHVRGGDPRRRERVWIVHRLDRDTSGLMVFAKSEAAKRALQDNWDAAEKKYFAVVEGAPAREAGRLESWLDEANPLKVYAAPEGPRTRRAVCHYRVLKRGRGRTLLEVTLETGRRHQIRVQLAEAGWPVVGDGKYGATSDPAGRLALHAASLRFAHPVTGRALSFHAPLPGELGELVGSPPPSKDPH